MDEKNKNIIDNNFLSRGCSAPPRLYDKNDNIYKHGCSKFDSYDWLADLPAPDAANIFPFVEVRFKNSRLEFLHIGEEDELQTGDIVAVEGSPGHDIGIISLAGEAARIQMRKKKLDPGKGEFKKIYRRKTRLFLNTRAKMDQCRRQGGKCQTPNPGRSTKAEPGHEDQRC